MGRSKKMFVDLTCKVSQFVQEEIFNHQNMAQFGHLGTHFDVMNKEFPLTYLRKNAVAFDVTGVFDRDIESSDVNLELISSGMFVAFHTGFIETVDYGSEKYFKDHPVLSCDLIDQLLESEISIIGIDFAGIRRGAEHATKDQFCADNGVFIVENLCNLGSVLNGEPYRTFVANTFSVNFEGMSGLPCRVIAEI
jgi:kynurenine formamidase